MPLINTIMEPLEVAVAWIMVTFHTLLTQAGMPAASGWTWALAIVGLVVVIRTLLIPLFVKQIKASRRMQAIQPDLRRIQDKYKGRTDPASRQAMTRETMELYRSSGTNPLASCLPILLQSPIFFALFKVLNGIPKERAIGALDEDLVRQADQASIFGAPISDTFLAADGLATVLVSLVLIVLMSAATFTTQRQLMPVDAPGIQRAMLFGLPIVFAVSGVNFPIGVLIYWITTNIWSMGQQFYVIRRMPPPGSRADLARSQRMPAPVPAPAVAGGSGQRQQPKRTTRRRR